jgi:hypothetical protein
VLTGCVVIGAICLSLDSNGVKEPVAKYGLVLFTAWLTLGERCSIQMLLFLKGKLSSRSYQLAEGLKRIVCAAYRTGNTEIYSGNIAGRHQQRSKKRSEEAARKSNKSRGGSREEGSSSLYAWRLVLLSPLPPIHPLLCGIRLNGSKKDGMSSEFLIQSYCCVVVHRRAHGTVHIYARQREASPPRVPTARSFPH